MMDNLLEDNAFLELDIDQLRHELQTAQAELTALREATKELAAAAAFVNEDVGFYDMLAAGFKAEVRHMKAALANPLIAELIDG